MGPELAILSVPAHKKNDEITHTDTHVASFISSYAVATNAYEYFEWRTNEREKYPWWVTIYVCGIKTPRNALTLFLLNVFLTPTFWKHWAIHFEKSLKRMN